MSKNLMWFKEFGIKDIPLVGGKNASLGEMIQNLSERKIYKEEDVLNILMESIKEAGFIPGKDVSLSLDVAASSVYNNGIYNLGGIEYTSDQLIAFYKKLIYDFPIVSIEDGLAEDDWVGWKKLQKEIGSKITLIGDDVFVTNTRLIQKGIKEKAANAVLIKPNQIGTLSSTMNAIAMAKKAGWKWVVSHRSGETLDTTIADISYATNAYGLKSGSPHQRPDVLEDNDVRRVKYDRMAYLENLEEIKSKKTPIGLIILDGWGLSSKEKGNAIKLAETKNFDYLWNNYPHTSLSASGADVGLPMGEMGNSEVGHLNIGAGRVVKQDVCRINDDIKSGKFFKNEALYHAFAMARKNKSNVHLVGLVSNAVIHSSLGHLFALLSFAKREHCNDVFVHAITDGRDSAPTSASSWLKILENKMKAIGIGKIASLCGRYYAMDRDQNWKRTKEAYDLYVNGIGEETKSWKEALDKSYKNEITDEFIKPVMTKDFQPIKDNDVVIFFDFRPDRPRQITEAFMNKSFSQFKVKSFKNLTWVCLTNYDDKFSGYKNLFVAYKTNKLQNTLGEVLSQNNLHQLRIAETEKYAHVTYFFNGGNEIPFLNEQRILIPSPKEVPTYDLKPEMSASKVTETLLAEMSKFDFFTLNFANPDMVGHTGNLKACIKAIQAVDYNLGRIIQKGKELGYTFIIIADHGNAEEVDVDKPETVTAHSTNPVPFILVDFHNKLKGIELKQKGTLANVAPTILDILEITKPKEMNASSIIIKKGIDRTNISKKYFIKSIEAEQILDSRNKPTVKARVILDNNMIGDWACVPAGKSTGKGEAPIVSTEEALKNIKVITREIIGKNIFSQQEIDSFLMRNLLIWGGNTTLAISLAVAKAAALARNQELYEYLRYTYPQAISQDKTRFLMNVFNGGLHALNKGETLGVDKPSTQEFMINIKTNNYTEALDMADKIYWSVKYILARHGYNNTSFGDEGGYSPHKIKGLNIPDGFALTSFAYFNYLKDTGLDKKIKDILTGWKIGEIEDLQTRGKKVRELVKKTPLPKSLEKETLEYYAELSQEYKTKNISVAVRSSATEEDSTDASFAGMHESFLNISGGQNLLKAIKECYISLFTDRAISYRIEKGFDHMKIGLSVCVQKMVRSDLASSGVIFSCDTETNFGDVVLINSSYGLGENIVKGRVEADQFYVFEKTLAQGFKPILEKRLGRKEEKLIYVSNTKGTTKNIKTTKEEQDNFSLTDQEILQLARYSMIIEAHYGKSMDMEFAKDGVDNKLYIVQARPETVQSRKDIQALEQYKLKKEGKILAKGLSIGSKISQGKVRIITDIKKLKEFKKGETLVTHVTDPDWVPAMKLASAIITESGSRTCFSGRTLMLTNNGFMSIADIVKRHKEEDISVVSLNEKSLKLEWKKVMDGFKQPGDLTRIIVSQTGKSKINCLEVTPDHKFLTFKNREIISKPISSIIDNNEAILTVDRIPQFKYDKRIHKKYNLNEYFGYFLGGMLTDGSLHQGKTTCEATFIQKDIPSKQDFINKMSLCLEKLYNEPMHKKKPQICGGVIRGRQIIGEGTHFCCYKKKVVADLIDKKNHISEITMQSDETFLYNFLAGVIDGDGSYNKEAHNRVHIYCSNNPLAQAIIISCLRLGIEFQVADNRNIYNIQLVGDKIKNILQCTKRVSGNYYRDKFGTKLFASSQLLSDIIERVNYKGRILPYVLGNLLIDSNKIRDYIIPMIRGQVENHELTKIINSPLKMLRVKFNKDLGKEQVYNIEVADNHNYLVFTDHLTPVVVANCHAAIVGREIGVATIVGVKDAAKIFKNGQKVTVSCAGGEEGKIYDGFLDFEIKKTDISKIQKPNIKIMMNIGEPGQAFNLSFIPNDGVGLAREEFIISNDIKIHPQALIDYKKLNPTLKDKIDKLTPGYTNKTDYYVDTLARGIAKIGAAFYPKDVIVRFSDFKTNEYRGLLGGDMYEPPEENPMMGWRGASRYYDPKFEEAFKLECIALKRVRDEFGLTNVIPMIPFCRTVEEGRKTIDVMNSCGLKQGENGLKVYVMCEIPSNVILADEFLDIFDGMSIGSNDLTQLALGIDRDNGGLHSIADERNEAVKKLVKEIIHKCNARNKYIGICGQAPSDYPEFAQFLISEGIRSISLNPDSVLKIMKELE